MQLLLHFIVYSAHRNDLENLLPSLVLGFMYMLTNPSPAPACLLFKIGAIARIIHTIVYAIIVIPQPARALSCFVQYAITIYMGVSVVFHLTLL